MYLYLSSKLNTMLDTLIKKYKKKENKLEDRSKFYQESHQHNLAASRILIATELLVKKNQTDREIRLVKTMLKDLKALR